MNELGVTCSVNVSTRAPVKGATAQLGKLSVSIFVSTRAPVKGATIASVLLSDVN